VLCPCGSSRQGIILNKSPAGLAWWWQLCGAAEMGADGQSGEFCYRSGAAETG